MALSLALRSRATRRVFGWAWASVVRHASSKPNIQKPRVPHWERINVMEATAKTVFPPDNRHPREKCERLHVVKEKELHPYEVLIGKELLKRLDNNAMVGIYQENSIKGRPKMFLKKLLLRNGLMMINFGSYMATRMLKGTNYEAMIPLLTLPYALVVSNEIKVDVLLKLQKKMPEYILMAGIVGNRLMSKEEMVWFASLGNLESVRAQLSATLGSAAAQVTHQLGYHQQHLCHSLSSLAAKQGESGAEESVVKS